MLARIPDGATVAASNQLALHLTARCRVLLFPTYPDSGQWPEWAVVAESDDVILLRNGSGGP